MKDAYIADTANPAKQGFSRMMGDHGVVNPSFTSYLPFCVIASFVACNLQLSESTKRRMRRIVSGRPALSVSREIEISGLQRNNGLGPSPSTGGPVQVVIDSIIKRQAVVA